ncbi:MAG: class I SAM-dependent methyltransferase [Moorea sp. SIO4A3]|nr:class I SAM-dependent methyltransferase [Moorena sp. SIO4A3]
MTSNFFSTKEKFFDLWAPNYDILFTTVFYQALHKRLLEFVEFTDQPNVLDLGCGTGRLLNRFAQEFPNLRGTGVDLSTKMLAQARQKNQHRQRIIYRKGNAESLPFADREFEAVFNTISFLHYLNPQQVFSEVSRVLEPKGHYYLVDYTVRKRKKSLPISPNQIRFYSRQQREEFGQVAGLSCLGHHHLLGPVVLSIFEKP